MKKILLLLLLFTTQLFAQNPNRKLNRFVKEKNVKRIIKTLSADEMKGRDARKPTEIIKASVFIEKEFENIGLKKWNSISSFKQEFMVLKIEGNSFEILVDDVQISKNETIVISEANYLFLNKNIPKVKIEKNEKFWEEFQTFNRDSISNIILVDSAHINSFKQAANYYNGPQLKYKQNTKPTGDVFILGYQSAQKIDVKISQNTMTLPMNNVIGVLEGKSKKNEYVIFSAHYDHLGYLATTNGDSIANGADDDASGTTAVIALAKYFKKLNNNERTLIFVAFTAEEIGGFGAKYFSENMNPDQVMAMVNIEMIGKASKWGKNSAFMTGFDKSDLGKIMQKNLVGTPFQINPDPYPEQDLFYRSDNATLARQGVPAHSFSTDQIDSDKLYHTVDDEYESLDVSNIVATIKALAIATKSIVSGADTPTRVDKAGVRK